MWFYMCIDSTLQREVNPKMAVFEVLPVPFTSTFEYCESADDLQECKANII